MNPLAAYSDAGKGKPDEALIEHLALVKRIAYHMLNRLPASVQLDDLIQAGVVGLLEASRNYDSGQGASFETYAGIRIRGAILDEVRRNDWAPRSVHRKSRMVSEAMRALEHEKGRDATDVEVAEVLGISLDEYHHILQDAKGSRVFSLDELQENGVAVDETLEGAEPGPEADVQGAGFKGALIESIDNLPEREKLVISLYYDEELNLREIGEVLGVSESRVCQIHSQAVARLRSKMRDWVGEE